MDISEEEMKKGIKDIKPSRLESLLELSLRITSANSDPYKDDLKVKLFFIDLKSMIMRIQNIDTQNGEHSFHFFLSLIIKSLIEKISQNRNKERTIRDKFNWFGIVLTGLRNQMAAFFNHK